MTTTEDDKPRPRDITLRNQNQGLSLKRGQQWLAVTMKRKVTLNSISSDHRISYRISAKVEGSVLECDLSSPVDI